MSVLITTFTNLIFTLCSSTTMSASEQGGPGAGGRQQLLKNCTWLPAVLLSYCPVFVL